jgi:hypothetical protein
MILKSSPIEFSWQIFNFMSNLRQVIIEIFLIHPDCIDFLPQSNEGKFDNKKEQIDENSPVD